jgi:curved DNA-binding protein CbpA
MNIILRDIKYLKGRVCNFGGKYNYDTKNPYDGKYNKDGTQNPIGIYDILGKYIRLGPIADETNRTKKNVEKILNENRIKKINEERFDIISDMLEAQDYIFDDKLYDKIDNFISNSEIQSDQTIKNFLLIYETDISKKNGIEKVKFYDKIISIMSENKDKLKLQEIEKDIKQIKNKCINMNDDEIKKYINYYYTITVSARDKYADKVKKRTNEKLYLSILNKKIETNKIDEIPIELKNSFLENYKTTPLTDNDILSFLNKFLNFEIENKDNFTKIFQRIKQQQKLNLPKITNEMKDFLKLHQNEKLNDADIEKFILYFKIIDDKCTIKGKCISLNEIEECFKNKKCDEIRSYKNKLSMVHHPDKNPGNICAEEVLKNINAHYDKLLENCNN